MAVDYFLKLDTIEGEAVDKGFEKQIKVHSWSWSAHNVSSVLGSGGSGAGKVEMSDLSVSIDFDKSSPALQKAVTKGSHLKSGVLSAVKAGGDHKPYLVITMDEVFISTLSYGASSEIPSVSLTMSYKSFEVKYSTQDAKGVLTAAGNTKWDRTTNVTT